ncbi:hypothetical protein [Bacillus cereus]|nr:hypothetical protein [Bacillus cereus]
MKELSIDCGVSEVPIYEEEMRLKDLKRRQKEKLCPKEEKGKF